MLLLNKLMPASSIFSFNCNVVQTLLTALLLCRASHIVFHKKEIANKTTIMKIFLYIGGTVKI